MAPGLTPPGPPEAGDFFLTEQHQPDAPPGRDVHGDDLTLPARDRHPTDPGFVLTWIEHPAGRATPVVRCGIVLSPAPPPRSVWVVPDLPHAGDGYAVLVRGVTPDGAAGAVRHVGGPGDYASTARWQAPRSLPRAWLRIDTVTDDGGAGPRPVALLHARVDCPLPEPDARRTVRRGTPTRVGECYLFDAHLHPASILPPAPAGATGRSAAPCGRCLQRGAPP